MLIFIVFYNVSNTKSRKLSFSDEFKHVDCIIYDGETWLHVDMNNTGLHFRPLKVTTSDRFMNALRAQPEVSAIFAIKVDERANIKWFPIWGKSCNEYVRHAASLDIGFTFNPKHLYKKLIKFKELRNYHVLTHWRRNHGK